MTRALLEQAEKTLASTLYEVEEKWFDTSDIRKTLASIRAELAATEPERKPMKTEQIFLAWSSANVASQISFMAGAKAAEAFHGILPAPEDK